MTKQSKAAMVLHYQAANFKNLQPYSTYLLKRVGRGLWDDKLYPDIE